MTLPTNVYDLSHLTSAEDIMEDITTVLTDPFCTHILRIQPHLKDALRHALEAYTPDRREYAFNLYDVLNYMEGVPSRELAEDEFCIFVDDWLEPV